MKPHAGNEFAAFIGIDWADAKHVLAGPTPLGENPASWRLRERLDATRSGPAQRPAALGASGPQ